MKGALCVSLWVRNEQSRLKFFSEMAKVFFWLKSWRKFMYTVYIIHAYSDHV